MYCTTEFKLNYLQKIIKLINDQIKIIKINVKL